MPNIDKQHPQITGLTTVINKKTFDFLLRLHTVFLIIWLGIEQFNASNSANKWSSRKIPKRVIRLWLFVAFLFPFLFEFYSCCCFFFFFKCQMFSYHNKLDNFFPFQNIFNFLLYCFMLTVAKLYWPEKAFSPAANCSKDPPLCRGATTIIGG